MSRWIDADKLHEAMQWAIEHDMYDKPFDYIAEVLDAPSIDIVRCKECKYWQKSRERAVMCCMREVPNRPMVADDFCSYGESDE